MTIDINELRRLAQAAMTHTEVITILRQFNEWQKGDGPLDYSPNGLINAVDTAIEMIERMEKLQAENDELRTKIEAMERQEPVACVWRCDNGHIHGSCEKTLPMGAKLYALATAQPAPSVPVEAIGKMLADAMAVAVSNGANSVSMPDEYVEVAVWLRGISSQPTPSVPEDFSREELEAVAAGLDTYEKTVNVGNVTGEGDDHLESTTAYAARFIRAMIAIAPEAKS